MYLELKNRKPPSTRDFYQTNRRDSGNDDQEYEFGEPPPSSRNKRRLGDDELLQDALTRRILSIVSPMNHSTSSTGEVFHINGPLPFIANNASQVSCSLSKYPHPSFHYRYRDVMNDGNDNDDMGYHHHAYFFHPRKITADQPLQHTGKESLKHHDEKKINVNNDYDPWSNNQDIFNNGYNDVYSNGNENMTMPPPPQQTQQPHQFGYSYDHNGWNEQGKKKKRKQKKITQSATGELQATTPSSTGAQGWAQVGQIASYHSNLEEPVQNVSKTKKSKKKKKKDSTVDIRSSIMRDDATNGEHTNDNEQASKPAKKSKQDKRSFSKGKSQTSSKSTTVHQTNTTMNYDPIPMETLETFAEHYKIGNAGASSEALHEFVKIVQEKRVISWTIVFHDEICSTPFLPSTKKYCTPKGKTCTMWNCTCDNQIRAQQAAAPVVGAMFVFPLDDDQPNDLDCFLLPLCPIDDPDEGLQDIDSGFERTANWPPLKITCRSTLQERWGTFRKILLDKSLIKVTFQANVGLMPFHFHCAYDVINTNTEERNFGYLDLVLPNIWDLRLASWMLKPHGKEEDLELDIMKKGFAHFFPKEKVERPSNPSSQLIGLIETKENLEFMYTLFPLFERLLDTNGLKDAFCEIEGPVQSVLSSMECFGIGFKAKRLMKIQQEIEARLDSLTSEAKEIAQDNTFLISSPQQVSALLFEKMGLSLPVESQANQHSGNSTNHKSTSEESLKSLQKSIKARGNPGLRIIDLILEFRALNKVLTTYIRPYPHLARDSVQIHSRKGQGRSKKKSKKTNTTRKIHPMWMQTAVRTGRLSCRKPNMQQVPSGSVIKGVHPRNFFTCSSQDSCLFACDYSQNEVRILAHMSNDQALIRLFSQPDASDIYKQMSSVINGKNVDQVTDDERAVSKQVTLAILYGMGINSVAKKLGINKSQAKSFFNAFYGRFQGVKSWMDNTIRFARENKYVTTITGRRRWVSCSISASFSYPLCILTSIIIFYRYLDDISSDNRELKSKAERQAINTVIQGSAADLMKLAMLKMANRITDWRQEGGIPPKLLLQIHDELLFEIPANQSDVDKLKSVVTRACTEECQEELRLSVPLKLKCSVGLTWGNMDEI